MGFSTTELSKMRGYCIKQLRHIFGQPAHVTHISNHTFLHQHHLQDPLALFLATCQRWIDRLQHRQDTLHSSDILHHIDTHPLYDRLGVLSHAVQTFHAMEASELFHSSRPTPSADVDHPGKLRVRDMTMAKDGLPTCVHCSQHFTTWDSFYQHVEYVCPMTTWQATPTPAVDDRLAALVEVLLTGPDDIVAHPILQQHLLSHCCICDRYCGSSNALRRHWAQDHATVFAQHGRRMSQLLTSCSYHDPCHRCGKPNDYRRNCIILRQMAMAAASLDLPLAPVADQDFETTLYPCRYCAKSYTTQHGRKMREDSIHAHRDTSNVTDAMRQLLRDAVQTQQCELLLPCKELLQILNHECAVCGFQTQRRNSLTRHFRQVHSAEWPRAEQMLLRLVSRLQSTHECHCDPPSKQRKHQCMLYQQFALLSTVAGMSMTTPPEPLAAASMDIPPTPTLHSTMGLVHCALTLGLINQILHSDDLAYDLTHVCFQCGEHFDELLQFTQHMRDEHADDWMHAWNRTHKSCRVCTQEISRVFVRVLLRTHRCIDVLDFDNWPCSANRQTCRSLFQSTSNDIMFVIY